MGTRPLLNRRLTGMGTTIFAEMSALATATGSINLGQGFPDTDGPEEVREAAVRALRDGRGNQYPPGPGIPELRTAIALEPFYDSYAACIAMAGATRVPLTLRAPAFRPDLDELRALITPRTRLLLINTPHNPTGTVLTAEELSAVAALAVEHDLLVVTDEVYEHLVFGAVHHPLAALPGMRERTVTISSAGKTFSFTGWKVGWVTASPDLVAAVRTAKQYLTYVSAGPFQYAVAEALRLPDTYFDTLRADLLRKRDLLLGGLTAAGFRAFTPEGTYFVTTDITPLGEKDGIEFCRALPGRCGVVAIPNAVFYDDVEAGRSLVRFTFCKKDEVLQEAVTRLRRL
ncbi:aminotransferase class I/II-fold pyridoxal phosphate-dependent enzyme [Kitasatospora sp. NPDC006786]|uniref:aminotransferase class I/II-fold pyridoxal phosphate-dependent enzyme n=1 Tax=unclassified Kitasatospora TaxID=2633591 RepID=UPI0033FEB99B